VKPGDRLFVDYRKWGDGLHWHYDVHHLGEDEHGLWFCLPRGSTVQKADAPERIYPRTNAMLVPRDAWWIAYWTTDRSQDIELYIDVATPPRIDGETLRTIDLDLDVARMWDGRIEVLDEDEFELHQRQLGYPPDVIETARRVADELVRAVETGAEPFANVGASWMERAEAFVAGRA
jgi:protein associated with RNAse G/E